jgi:hypothetical protein
MITDTIINITKDKTSGLHPPYGKIYIRKIKHMSKDYPDIVCLDCLNEAWEDTKNFDGRTGQWSGAYSVYTHLCGVCGQTKECTEPRDAGYPNFEYVIQRIRTKKLNKIKNNIDDTISNT